MDFVNFFKDLNESIPDYKRIVLLLFLIENGSDFLIECGFLENDIKSLIKEFRNILLERNEEYSDYNKNEEESLIERFLNKKMEQYFAVMSEDVRNERSSYLLLSLTDPDILRQRKITDHEINIIKNLALEKLHR